MSARLDNDPDKYIRQVKGRKWQARPFDEGRRENLGTFDSIGEARQALKEYWWGKRKPKLKFTRRFSNSSGTWWVAVVRVPQEVQLSPKGRQLAAATPRTPHQLGTVNIGGKYATAEEAHEAAVAWLLKELGLFAWVTILGLC